MRRLPHNTLPTHGKIADGANKRHDAGQKTQEKEKNGQKDGNEPSHDETFPHRTYIEMKKLSRNLVVNVTTPTTMVGALSLTPRKYGQKSNRPNIYPIFFIQIVNDFVTFLSSQIALSIEHSKNPYQLLTTTKLYFISSRGRKNAQQTTYQKISNGRF